MLYMIVCVWSININIRSLSWFFLKRSYSCPPCIHTPNWQIIACVEGELAPVTDFQFAHQADCECGHVLNYKKIFCASIGYLAWQGIYLHYFKIETKGLVHPRLNVISTILASIWTEKKILAIHCILLFSILLYSYQILQQKRVLSLFSGAKNRIDLHLVEQMYNIFVQQAKYRPKSWLLQ